MNLNNVTLQIKQIEVKKCIKHNCEKILRKDGTRWQCRKCNVEYVRKSKHKKKSKQEKQISLDVKIEKK